MADLEILLSQASPEALIRAIGDSRVERIQSLLEGMGLGGLRNDAKALGRLIVMLGGEATLESEQVRAILFSLLPPEVLAGWSRRWTKSSFEKTADNILALASVPWRSGSGLAIELADALGIPSEFLPRVDPQQPVSSIVLPFSAQPPLRRYQDEVKRIVVSMLREHGKRVLVQMPTGAGKTRTIMSALVELAKDGSMFERGRSILWLAHVEELCEQSLEAFHAEWTNAGYGPATAVRCFASHKPSVEDFEGSFLVATYQKMAALQRTGNGEFRRLSGHVDIIVVDEAHKIIAPTFMGVLADGVLGNASVIGITATPGRGLAVETENVRLADFFGRNLVGPSLGDNPIRELRARGILATVRYRTIDSGINVALTAGEERIAADIDLPTTLLSRLAESVERNRRIVEAIADEVAQGRTCLVFACSVEHSRLLAATLSLRGVPTAHLDSTVSHRMRRSLIGRFKESELKVLTNFGVLSTGFDAPRVGSVVVARPTTSLVLYSQMVGRGLRGPASGGNAECNLIDVRDNFKTFGDVDQVYAAFADYWN
jgi:DNA repair protein RadD